MSKKRKSLKELRAENSSLLDDIGNVIAIKEEVSGIDMNLKAIECRVVKISRNQRKLLLTPNDIAQDGSLIIKNDKDRNFEKKQDEYNSLIPMAASINENGLQNPISVYIDKGNYYLKAGQRRLLSSLIAAKKTILARVANTGSENYELEITQWVENFHREGLSTRDTMAAVKEITRLWKAQEQKDITVTQLAKALYCSKGQATKYYSLLHAPSDIKDAIDNGQLSSLRKAYELARIKDNEKRESLLKAAINGEISQDELSKIVASSLKSSKESSDNKKGKKVQRASLGSTASVNIIKDLIDSVLACTKYKMLNHLEINNDFSDLKEASNAFKKLVEKMETCNK